MRVYAEALFRNVRSPKRAWHFMKAAHEAAYNQLPLREEHSRPESVTLRNPADGCRHSFRSRTLLFGAVAAVLRYNVFSRISDALFARLFGIPVLSFFANFGALVPAFLPQKALGAFASFCKNLGITLKAEEDDVGPMVTPLGIRGFFPVAQMRRICAFH